jgi:hypothetical protein
VLNRESPTTVFLFDFIYPVRPKRSKPARDEILDQFTRPNGNSNSPPARSTTPGCSVTRSGAGSRSGMRRGAAATNSGEGVAVEEDEEDQIVDQAMEEIEQGGDQDEAPQEEMQDASASPKPDDDMAIDQHRIAHHPAPSSLPVDPNEPTYCVCNQVSFGDNEESGVFWRNDCVR